MATTSAWAKAVLLSCLVLSGCYSPSASIEAGAMSEDDTATYLVLTDQLERVRNIYLRSRTVCLALLPNGPFGGLGVVPGQVMERLQRDQSVIEPRLELTSDPECLVHYAQEKGFIEPRWTDVLAYAGAARSTYYLDPSLDPSDCGEWFGGLHSYTPRKLSRQVSYDTETVDGIAKLTGGENCVRMRW